MSNAENSTTNVQVLTDLVIEIIQDLLANGASPHALAGVLIGTGGDLLRQVTNPETAARTMNAAAIELAREAVGLEAQNSSKH